MYYWLYWYRVHLYHRRESNSQTWVIATDVNTIQYNRSNDGQLSQNAQNPSVEICFHTLHKVRLLTEHHHKDS